MLPPDNRWFDNALAYAKLGLIIHELVLYKEAHRGKDLLALLDRVEAVIATDTDSNNRRQDT